MAIEFSTETIDETRKMGDDTFTLPNGKFLKVETTPGGVEYLNFENTTGGDLSVHVWVNVTQDNS